MTPEEIRRKKMIEELKKVNKISRNFLPEEQNIPNTDIQDISIPVKMNERSFPGANKMMVNEMLNQYSSPSDIQEDAIKRIRQRIIEEEAMKQLQKDPSFNQYGGNV